MPDILKKSSKHGIDLQPFFIFSKLRGIFYFKLGIVNSVHMKLFHISHILTDLADLLNLHKRHSQAPNVML